MTGKRRHPPSKTGRAGTTGRADWALGCRSAPFTVEKPSPFRPDVLILVDAGNDRIADVEVANPGMSPEEVAAWAAPRLPERRTRLRVEDEEIASSLAERVGGAVWRWWSP